MSKPRHARSGAPPRRAALSMTMSGTAKITQPFEATSGTVANSSGLSPTKRTARTRVFVGTTTCDLGRTAKEQIMRNQIDHIITERPIELSPVHKSKFSEEPFQLPKVNTYGRVVYQGQTAPIIGRLIANPGEIARACPPRTTRQRRTNEEESMIQSCPEERDIARSRRTSLPQIATRTQTAQTQYSRFGPDVMHSEGELGGMLEKYRDREFFKHATRRKAYLHHSLQANEPTGVLNQEALAKAFHENKMNVDTSTLDPLFVKDDKIEFKHYAKYLYPTAHKNPPQFDRAIGGDAMHKQAKFHFSLGNAGVLNDNHPVNPKPVLDSQIFSSSKPGRGHTSLRVFDERPPRNFDIIHLKHHDPAAARVLNPIQTSGDRFY